MEMPFTNWRNEETSSGQRSAITLDSPAKLNLFLEIHGKRPDGFHELETVMTTVSLADRLSFSALSFSADGEGKIREGEIRLTLSGREALVSRVPTDQRNLVVRALQLLKDTAGDSKLGCEVHLHKRIPLEAGLGGASSNAAAALLAGNRIWQLGYNLPQLRDLASKLGSDVPFFLGDSTALCQGRGEKIRSVPRLPAGIPLVIAMPRTGLSTPLVYSRVNVPGQPVASDSMVASLSVGNLMGVGRELFNRLQPIAASLNPEIDRLSRFFGQTFPVGHLMSGSGASYFGIYANVRQAIGAARILSSRLPDVSLFSCWTGRYNGNRRLLS